MLKHEIIEERMKKKKENTTTWVIERHHVNSLCTEWCVLLGVLEFAKYIHILNIAKIWLHQYTQIA